MSDPLERRMVDCMQTTEKIRWVHTPRTRRGVGRAVREDSAVVGQSNEWGRSSLRVMPKIQNPLFRDVLRRCH